MVRTSVPASSRWTANEWRKLWGVTPLLHPHDHAVAVNRADRQAEGFGDAQTGCIAGLQNHPMVGHPMVGQVDAVEEADDLVRA